MDAVNNPEDASAGTRKVPFSRVLYIEQDDFREDPPKQYFRLSPGKEVRLRYGYFITCTSVVKDEKTGEILEIHCTYDPATRGGNAPDGRKVKSTIHWVSAAHAIDAEVRLYDNLFAVENPNAVPEGQDFTVNLNPNSLEVVTGAKLEPSLRGAAAGSRYQFERLGYFCVDPDSTRGEAGVQPDGGAARYLGARSRKRSREKDDHSGNRRHTERCCQRHSEGRPTGRGGRGIEDFAARARRKRANCPKKRSPRAWSWPACGRTRWIAWRWRGRFRAAEESDLHLKLRSRFPHSRMALIDHHARMPRRRFMRRHLMRPRCWCSTGAAISAAARAGMLRTASSTLGKGAVLAGFAGRALRARDRAARIQRQCRRAQSAVAVGGGRGPLSRSVSRNSAVPAGEWPRLDRSYFDAERMTHGGFSAKVLRAHRSGGSRGHSGTGEGAAGCGVAASRSKRR